MLCLLSGAVRIPAVDVVRCLTGHSPSQPVFETIILSSRLPMTITAILCGMALSVSGLLLQTAFQNPLAGPSILGVSTGASLGVAITVLSAGSFLGNIFGFSYGMYVATFAGAFIGSAVVIGVLSSLSTLIRNAAMLLIVGILIGYLASSIISLLNFFAPAMQVKMFTVWGLGSFADVPASRIPVFAWSTLLTIAASFLLIKPLNAFLLGERYAVSMGYNIQRTRTYILLVSGILTAIATAFCGPIAFIGLIVPHISRMVFATSNHYILLPSTLLIGATTSLICQYLSNGIFDNGIIPINAITPVIGVPIIIYVIINRGRLRYFN